jgi:hypothetical protein
VKGGVQPVPERILNVRRGAVGPVGDWDPIRELVLLEHVRAGERNLGLLALQQVDSEVVPVLGLDPCKAFFVDADRRD